MHYIWPNKKGQLLIGAEDSMPTYEALLALLQRVPGSKSSQSWVERALNSSPLTNSEIVSAKIPQGTRFSRITHTPYYSRKRFKSNSNLASVIFFQDLSDFAWHKICSQTKESMLNSRVTL